MTSANDDRQPAAIASTSLVETARPARYGKQLTSHLSRRLTTSWDDVQQTGVVEFDHGQCDLGCTDDGLLMQVQVRGDSDQALTLEWVAHMEDVVGRHLVRFGARDELVARWRRTDGSDGSVYANSSAEAE